MDTPEQLASKLQQENKELAKKLRAAQLDSKKLLEAQALITELKEKQPSASNQSDLKALAKANDHARKLDTQLMLAKKELASIKKDNDTAAKIRETIYGLRDLTPDPPEFLTKIGPVNLPGVPCTMWSDWHYGEVVDPTQIGGVNTFNRKIAKERIKRLVDITLDLTLNHMVKPIYPGIVVCLGGDFISGNIHDELRETNDGPVQQSLLEVQEQLIAALKVMADKFGKVFVPCVVGNHGRTTLKPRAKNRVYESYEWNLYMQLASYFRDDPRIVFHIPDETDAHFTVLGHRFCLTHGDALGVKGGDGIIGAIGPIARGAMKVGRSEAQIGRDFDTLLMGHYHTYIPRGDAVPVLVNGALKGYDEYARTMLRVPYSRPSQALWFIHAKHGFTATWPIYLDEVRKTDKAAGREWLSWNTRSKHEQ